jgi:hypothetical protein
MKAQADNRALTAAVAARREIYRDLARRNERRARMARVLAAQRERRAAQATHCTD